MLCSLALFPLYISLGNPLNSRWSIRLLPDKHTHPFSLVPIPHVLWNALHLHLNILAPPKSQHLQMRSHILPPTSPFWKMHGGPTISLNSKNCVIGQSGKQNLSQIRVLCRGVNLMGGLLCPVFPLMASYSCHSPSHKTRQYLMFTPSWICTSR